MNPLVSIVIPVFNHSKYIKECLDSILSLDYDNIEVVLCDDGSTDDSYIKVENWLKENPCVRAKLLCQSNQGVCKTLNRLVNESSGDYIVICASDDSLTPDSIRVRYDFLSIHSELYAVIGDAYVIGEDSKIISKSAMRYLYSANYSNLKNNICNELILRWSVVGPTIMIRRCAYDFIGMYDENLLIEDREFYLRLLKVNRLGFLASNVANYRVHSSNASRKSITSKLIISSQVAIANLKHCNDFGVINNLFLRTHVIDLFLVSLGSNFFTYYLLFIYRGCRRLLFTPFRFFRR
ncbi:glycosyltransferase family 2 protein [Shewanella sp. Koi 1]